MQGYKDLFNNLVGSKDLPKDENVNVYDVYVENPDSDKDLRLRIYKPVNKQDNFSWHFVDTWWWIFIWCA